jgi:hypothetical protein
VFEFPNELLAEFGALTVMKRKVLADSRAGIFRFAWNRMPGIKIARHPVTHDPSQTAPPQSRIAGRMMFAALPGPGGFGRLKLKALPGHGLVLPSEI